MNTIIEGDILSIERGIICHQVNCRRVARAGLALQIRNKWPDWYDDYKQTPGVLGYIGTFDVTQELFVVNLYSQSSIGQQWTYTDYPALRVCLHKVRRFADGMAGVVLPVYLPYGLGCGLAGGDWNIVSTIIEEELPQATLVKFTRPNSAVQRTHLRDATVSR